MLTAFLAGSGGKVVIPDAVDVVEGESNDEVHFVDGAGKVLVVFRRADVALFSEDGAHLEAIKAETQTGTSDGNQPVTSQSDGSSGAQG